MVRFAAAVLCASVLVGCAGGQGGAPASGTANVEPLPPNYRQVIVGKVKEGFFDPYSIRDAAISQPLRWRSPKGPAASVCVRANAKNRMGGYTGIKTTAYVFRGGEIAYMDGDFPDVLCANAVFEPFAEIDSAPAKPPRSR